MSTQKLPFRNVRTWKVDWIANNAQDKGGAQDEMLKNMKPDTFPILSLTRKFGRLWSAITAEDIERLIQTNHGLYEILHPTFKCKVYFDVDKTTLTLQEIKKIILDRFPNARLQISGREGSWHIILSNYYADDVLHMENVKKFAMEHVEEGFDKRVYHQNRNMKCINQSKPDKELQAYIEGDPSLTKHLIFHDFDEDAININTIDFGYADEVITTTRDGKKVSTTLDILSIPQHDLPVPQNFDWLTATPLDKLALLPNPPRDSPECHDHDICWQVMRWCQMVGISFDDCWAWLKKKDGSVERYKKYKRDWEGKRYYISPKLIDVMLERYYPDIHVSPSTQRFREQFVFDNVKLVDGVDGKYLQGDHIARGIARMPSPVKKIDLPGFRVLPPQPGEKGIKHTLLIDPMGRNKTGATIDHLHKYLQPHHRVLWLTPRITLSNNTMYRLQSVGIDVSNYKMLTKREKMMERMDDENFVICSIQSIHYLTKPFDYIIIDEPETVLNTFAGNCVTHRTKLNDNWEIFTSLVQQARKVVYMDAFTSNLTLNFVKGMIRKDTDHITENYEIVKTKSEADPRQFVEIDAFAHWMMYIFDCLQRGEKLYIFTPFKSGKQGVEWIASQIMDMFNWTENEEVLCYHADKEEEKRKLCDVEEVWGDPKVRCVVTNGTISVGVNFDQQDVFDKIFAHYNNMLSVRDFLQSMYRVRHPKSTQMFLVRSKMNLFGYEKLSIRHPKCPAYTQLREDIAVEELANLNFNQWQTFNMLCRLANITIQPLRLKKAIIQNEDYLARLEQDVELVFDWNRIDDILDYDTFKETLYKTYSNRATLDDRLQIEKYLFKRKFPENASEDEMKSVWTKKKDFIDKTYTLVRDEEHLVNQIFKENHLELDSTLPDGMITKIPVKELLQKFHFTKPIKNYESGLVAQVLNAFFGMRVYSNCEGKKRKRKSQGERGKQKQRYVYKETKDYRTLMDICLPPCIEKAKEQEACEAWAAIYM